MYRHLLQVIRKFKNVVLYMMNQASLIFSTGFINTRHSWHIDWCFTPAYYLTTILSFQAAVNRNGYLITLLPSFCHSESYYSHIDKGLGVYLGFLWSSLPFLNQSKKCQIYMVLIKSGRFETILTLVILIFWSVSFWIILCHILPLLSVILVTYVHQE